MPFSHGRKRGKSKVSSKIKPFKSSELDTEEENFPAKELFHGFEKMPLVLLERLNMKTLLDYNITTYKHHAFNPYDKSNIIQSHLNRLSLTCSVILVREDLEKLKKLIAIKPSQSDSLEINTETPDFKCKICNKVYTSEKRLLNHQTNKHMIVIKSQNVQPPKRVSFSDLIVVHEVKEYHRCRKCSRIFENYKCLKVHMKQQHKKRKCYICNYCLKKFVDRMFFKVHIKLHCDICGLLLPTKPKYLEHKRDVCRSIKLYNCNTCNYNFFNFMDLKDHSYEHVSTCFICDICKDQFETKCAIAHHISFLHSKKRPEALYTMLNLGNERLYLCNFCYESSVERDMLEIHTSVLPDLSNRVMTGYKDYYFCDQCLKKFDTETDMLQHKWTHFLKINDNSELRRQKKVLNKESEINMAHKACDIPESKVVPEKNQCEPIMKVYGDNNEEAQLKEVIEIPKKPVVDPITKKTILSRFNCEVCGKYYSSNYTLNRHKVTVHNCEMLRCNVCEEIFVWPTLLTSHKCIQENILEMPFDEAKPNIRFHNVQEVTHNGFDDLNIDSDDYSLGVDFDIPAPIVQLTEYNSNIITDSNIEQYNPLNDIRERVMPLQNLGYKLVMQEVPIEF